MFSKYLPRGARTRLGRPNGLSVLIPDSPDYPRFGLKVGPVRPDYPDVSLGREAAEALRARARPLAAQSQTTG